MSGNAGFLFYNEYYRLYTDSDWREILTINKSSNINLAAETKQHILTTNDLILKLNRDALSNDSFFSAEMPIKLTTIYPGLLIGTGYHHETGVEGEFKIGFYFDYTTGLPVIPGSSVKGLLRSAFPNRSNNNLNDEYKKNREAYLRELFKELNFENPESIEIDKLELEIFEGIKNKDAKKAREKYLPMNKRDIFHDAFPVNIGNDGLFRDDFITPHKDPLKNPIPLKFLKVSPGVTFQFNFDLKEGILKREDKLVLFMKILLDFGAGAKTNVGYGQFDESDKDNKIEKIKTLYAKQRREEKLQSMTPEKRRNEEKKYFIEEINKYKGKPSKIFNKWKNNDNLSNDKEIAQAILQIFKSAPSKPQLKHLSEVLGKDKKKLREQFN